MTRRERATRCAHEIARRADHVLPADIDIVEQAIIAAVEQEREACAKIADELRETLKAEAVSRASVTDEIADVIEDYSAATGTAELIARQIRARSKSK